MKVINVADPTAEAAGLRKSAAISDALIQSASEIMKGVAVGGDPALLAYAEKFDGAKPEALRVTRQEVDQAYRDISIEQAKTIRLMKERLEKSERALLKRLRGLVLTFEGVKIERQIIPVASVGCYVPGGKARYPSTLVMCAVPAKVAGVKRIVAISPTRNDGRVDPLTIATADICGVNEFYKIGGAHGIAALAYGTQSIKPVSKIVGPGGLYVTAAKLVASKMVSTDMVAGPTELLVYADSSADPRIVAADLVSQAEHSADTICGLVTSSQSLANEVQSLVNSIVEKIERSDIVKSSLEQNGFIAICQRESSCIEFANEFAPEHIEVITKNADAAAKKIRTAGLVLVGPMTPSSASDYCLGSNHVLPTLGFGKSRASLSVLDFVKVVNKVKVTKEGLIKVAGSIREIAIAEGLPNHYEAVRARMKEK
ncbi:MAG TPA: histidinol dehydrogenase [Nitrososphaera sp.]|jgi:histidinol dehydrogenase|nr:histidinol dehydrogenase [Nitrososphaera sp.]